MLHVVQVLVIGKISQAAILAAAAYRNHDTFKRQTGITNCRLIYDKEHHDTKVLLLCTLFCLYEHHVPPQVLPVKCLMTGCCYLVEVVPEKAMMFERETPCIAKLYIYYF